MSDLIGKKFSVLDHGHIVIMNVMGNDQEVVQAARTAYQQGTKHTSDDETLLRYLMRHRHSSPFESCFLKFHIKLPIFVERQWARHRTAGWNEVSARYSELPEEYYVPKPDEVRRQSTSNKQGSEGKIDEMDALRFNADTGEAGHVAFTQYQQHLASGVAREMARINLPLGAYTEKVWWINLHNLLHLLGLRMDSHAQKEIRDYANVIGNEIIKPLFPLTWQAFVDYRLESMTLSRLDIELIRLLSATTVPERTPAYVQNVAEMVFANKRERQEALDKLTSLKMLPPWST